MADPVDTLATQILQESEQQDLEMIFGQHLMLFFTAASQLYPLDEAMLDRFQGHWEWLLLSMNKALPWSEVFIERYKNHWHWWMLGSNEKLPWTEELIQCYQDRWDWKQLSCNTTLPWSEGFINRFCDKWDWQVLSGNEVLPLLLTDALIERFHNKWDWQRLSRNTKVQWSDDLIERYSERWDWATLSSNITLPWSGDLIERYRNKWNWRILSSNPGLPWCEGFSEPDGYRWQSEYWERLGNSSISPFSEQFIIERYRDFWDWNILSANTHLPWSVGFIGCYHDKWDWETLSGNKSLPWSNALIERYANRWHRQKLNHINTSGEVKGIRSYSDNSKMAEAGQCQVQRWSPSNYDKRAKQWNVGKTLPSFARYVQQLTSEQVVCLLDSYLEAAEKTEVTYAVYNLRTSFLREPGDMDYCPSCGSRIVRSEIEPSKKVARDMSNSNLMPLHYYSCLYLCSACTWWSVRERWGLLEIDSAEYDYLIAGMANQMDLAGKREAQHWRLALETESYLSALPLPHAWSDLFGPYYS